MVVAVIASPAMQRRILLFLVSLGCLAMAEACGGGGSNVPKCTPGQSIACVGPGSCQGNQVCAANGTYGACSCVSGQGGSVGTAGAGGTGTGGTAGTSGAAGMG